MKTKIHLHSKHNQNSNDQTFQLTLPELPLDKPTVALLLALDCGTDREFTV